MHKTGPQSSHSWRVQACQFLAWLLLSLQAFRLLLFGVDRRRVFIAVSTCIFLDRAAPDRLGLSVLSLPPKVVSQIVHGNKRVWMISAKRASRPRTAHAGAARCPPKPDRQSAPHTLTSASSSQSQMEFCSHLLWRIGCGGIYSAEYWRSSCNQQQFSPCPW